MSSVFERLVKKILKKVPLRPEDMVVDIGSNDSTLLQGYPTRGVTLVGIDPLATHEMVRMAKDIITNLNEGIAKIKNKEGTLGKLLYDDTLYKEIEAAITYKNGTIGRFIYDDSVYKEVESLVIDLRQHPWKLFWKAKEKPAKK